jgi:hypothetical protein
VHDFPRREEQYGWLACAVYLIENAYAVAIDEAVLVLADTVVGDGGDVGGGDRGWGTKKRIKG